MVVSSRPSPATRTWQNAKGFDARLCSESQQRLAVDFGELALHVFFAIQTACVQHVDYGLPLSFSLDKCTLRVGL